MGMKQFTIFLTVILALSCSKSEKKENPVICILPGEPAWLVAKKAEYSKCICLTGIRAGLYENQAVFEIYLFDPACDGINMVYTAEGNLMFTSADRKNYEDYTTKVQQQTIIWTCSKGSQ